MANIQRRERASGTVHCLRIRRKGYPLVSETFGTEQEAQGFVDRIEADLEGRGMPATVTVSGLFDLSSRTRRSPTVPSASDSGARQSGAYGSPRSRHE